ncbi:hypothetical protein CC77DRAFT_396713 [Alternaria alternata]|uniref:Uncharacterized protein n=1 Tax=Alternaria alternata TaxID=5599 RepID=A0A177DAN8_ALTAL|nr:hypothetical protein CC77DRAFT_396713 [Alternaria alternata]OAG16277.1 hypothetical protein CC77DRAFT_396713 [Alternaria alternata]
MLHIREPLATSVSTMIMGRHLRLADKRLAFQAHDRTGALAAMPCAPLLLPKAASEFFPAEIFKNIIERISGSQLHELFALRGTYCFYRSIATGFIRPYMNAKLKHLRVFITKVCLIALFEHMSVPQW